MTSDQKFYIFAAGCVVFVIVVIAWSIAYAVTDQNRQAEFRERCEASGGMVLAENGYDRVCVQGDFRPTERLNR